jgi:hypothetical protein
VFFARAGLNLDPGGVGKGYAVDKMVEVLKKDGIASALVSGGGSSIYCLGTPPGRAGLAIQHQGPGKRIPAGGRSDAEGRIAFHVRQLRKVFCGRRQNHKADQQCAWLP